MFLREVALFSGTMFPFDFTVPLADDCKRVSYSFVGASASGETMATKQYDLQLSGDPR